MSCIRLQWGRQVRDPTSQELTRIAGIINTFNEGKTMNVLRTTRKGIFGILVMLAVFHASFARSAAFDFDNGNAITEVIVPKGAQVLLNSAVFPSASDATLILRFTTLPNNAWFDAIAPYHPTAVGVYSRLGRRPASESTTNRNKNIAMLYATYRVYNSLFPQHAADWREMLTSVGLDPDDAQENTNTAIGIGNSAGNAVVAAREHDGMNQLGDEGGREYNRRPYADYLGYKPVNTAYKLRNPSRWQPNIITKGNGIFQVQQFVTPQMRVTLPYSYDDPNRFRAPFPTDSQVQNLSAYIRQADEILAASAALTDYQKMVAEFFNDKFASLGATGFFAAQAAHLNLDQFVHHNFLVNLAAFDTAIAVWNEKYRYDAVRPFSAIRFIYGDRPVTAWGGVGKGTVTDIPASQWKSYLDVADHPDYPSGSASFCSAHAQASRRFFGSDILGMSVPVTKGSSRVEPGITPAQNIVLGPWETLTEWEQECGLSRLWGGVHFMAAINAGHEIGQPIGDLAYEFVQKHIDGQAAPFHAVVR